MAIGSYKIKDIIVKKMNKTTLKPGNVSRVLEITELCAASKSQQHELLRVNRLKQHIKFFAKLIVPSSMSYI